LAKVKLLIIDELGFVPPSKTGAELLFELISQRCDRVQPQPQNALFAGHDAAAQNRACSPR